MSSSTRLGLIPLANVRCEDQGLEGRVWLSHNEDPQFLLGSPQLTLKGGWYLFEADFEKVDGLLVSPCLYPDYGMGVAESERVLLPEPDENGRVHTVILLKRCVIRLRFDPSSKAARFHLADVGLRRLGRVEALARMAIGVAGPTRDCQRAREVLLPFVRAAFAGRLRQGGDAAYARYLQLILPSSDDYTAWVRSYDTLDSGDIKRLRGKVDELVRQPLVSILVPVYETDERWLRRCLDSVLAQVYPNWELCIADDASPSPRVRRVLEEYARRDTRIRVEFRERNGHISEASNSALAIAGGEFIALLDHDDELRPHALLEVVETIARYPDTGLVYSDEDKIDAEGRRFDPYFKPDFDADLLRSQNYICHFTTIRADLVREVGGFRKGFEGSQDHDLILRCTEKLLPEQVRHIPKVLYHWRAIPGSTALSRDAKDYASSAGARAVTEHLSRRYLGARAEELSHGHYRVHWPLPETPPKVSLIIPTRDKVELLRMCVESILAKTTYPWYEIIVVDNQSSEPEALDYLADLERRDNVKVLRFDAPFNYSTINNWAISRATGEVIGLVNNDIEVISSDWLEEMVSQALRPDVGAVGAMLYYPNDTIQHAGVVLGIHGVAAHAYAGMPRGYAGHGGRARVAQGLSAVTAACLVVRRRVFDEVGALDGELQVAFNDIDFCLRLRAAGYRNIWTPFAELYHHESASRGYEDTPEKIARFNREVAIMHSRWGDSLLADPCYNYNLTVTSAPFDLAFPPRNAS